MEGRGWSFIGAFSRTNFSSRLFAATWQYSTGIAGRCSFIDRTFDNRFTYWQIYIYIVNAAKIPRSLWHVNYWKFSFLDSRTRDFLRHPCRVPLCEFYYSNNFNHERPRLYVKRTKNKTRTEILDQISTNWFFNQHKHIFPINALFQYKSLTSS